MYQRDFNVSMTQLVGFIIYFVLFSGRPQVNEMKSSEQSETDAMNSSNARPEGQTLSCYADLDFCESAEWRAAPEVVQANFVSSAIIWSGIGVLSAILLGVIVVLARRYHSRSKQREAYYAPRDAFHEEIIRRPVNILDDSRPVNILEDQYSVNDSSSTLTCDVSLYI